MKCFLRIGMDDLENSIPCNSVKEAKEIYKESAAPLYRFGQSLEGVIYIAKTVEELTDYPSYLLTYTGRVLCARCY